MVKETDYMISDQEILGGIKAAVERGSTLKQAMMTFYQAGYDKGEIEDAARAYMNQQRNQDTELNPAKIVQTPEKEKSEEKTNDKIPPKNPMQNQVPANPIPGGLGSSTQKGPMQQKASAYDLPKKKEVNPPKNNALTFILIFVLLFLFGVLAAVYLFKDELIQFVNSMFG